MALTYTDGRPADGRVTAAERATCPRSLEHEAWLTGYAAALRVDTWPDGFPRRLTTPELAAWRAGHRTATTEQRNRAATDLNTDPATTPPLEGHPTP